MSTVKNNNIFEKTSFLGGNSSEFIEELYAQYVQNPGSISNEWKEFFDGLRDKKEVFSNILLFLTVDIIFKSHINIIN